MQNEDVVEVSERLAVLLGCDVGERSIELHFSAGHLRNARAHAGPMKPDELRAYAAEISRVLHNRAAVHSG